MKHDLTEHNSKSSSSWKWRKSQEYFQVQEVVNFYRIFKRSESGMTSDVRRHFEHYLYYLTTSRRHSLTNCAVRAHSCQSVSVGLGHWQGNKLNTRYWTPRCSSQLFELMSSFCEARVTQNQNFNWKYCWANTMLCLSDTSFTAHDV